MWAALCLEAKKNQKITVSDYNYIRYIIYTSKNYSSVHKYMTPLTFKKLWSVILFKKQWIIFLFVLSLKIVCDWLKILHFWINILNDTNGQSFWKISTISCICEQRWYYCPLKFWFYLWIPGHSSESTLMLYIY